MHHTASVPEVGCRQLRRIDWAGRPICIFLFAFRRYAPPAVGYRLLRGRRAQRGGGAAPPNNDRALGRTFSRVRVFIRCRLPHQQATCWGRLLLWAARWTLLRPTALRLVPVLL